MFRRTLIGAAAGAVLCLAAGTASASNFSADVNTAINRGLEFLNTDGAFSGYNTTTQRCNSEGASGSGSYMRGMALLALLEKRFTGDLNTSPQGYSGASDVDKTRMRKAVACILDFVNENGQEAYYDGNMLMGLSFYARTGGPGKGDPDIPDVADLIGLTAAIDLLTDRNLAAQGSQTGNPTYRGMWYYSGPGPDSSTTQFAAAGLGGAKAYYISLGAGDTGGRAALITTALANARNAYATNGSTAGSDNSSCDRIEETEKGHGYQVGYVPSLQQTASGLWVQLLGGATVNDNSVQAYLRWIRNHYRSASLDSMGNGFQSYSYWYYMWSAMKGLLTIQESGQSPNPGNLGSASWGLLGPATDPNTGDTLPGTCEVRQLLKAPASVARNTAFGADPGSYYAGETQTVYFDFASEILSHQCASGDFACNSAPGAWYSSWDRVSWALLVLQRATGGACADLNANGICDSDEGNGGGDENAPGGMLCDADLDGKVTSADLGGMYAILHDTYPVAVLVTPANSWANYSSNGASAGTIDIDDFWQCFYVATGHLPIKYEGGNPD